MKILHVMDWYIPNVGYQENFLPYMQKRLGHEVNIITSDRLPATNKNINLIKKIYGNRIIGKGIYSDKGIEIKRLPVLIEYKNSEEIILKGLKESIQYYKPEIIQAHGAFCPSTMEVIYYSKKLGYKVFVDDHSHYHNFKIDSIIKKIYINLCRIFYYAYGNRVQCFMPVTYASKNILQTTLNLENERLDLLHLGANSEIFKKSSELRVLGRIQLGLSDKNKLLISSGKFTQNKDIHILIEAFRYICEINRNVKLLLLGNGPSRYIDELNTLIKKFSLSENVIFYNFVENSELPKYYNAADVGIWPGDHSITVIEAIACGLPVVVPEEDLAYEVLFENNAALKFKRGNSLDLSKKINQILDDHLLQVSLQENSIFVTSKILDWEKVAIRSIEIYNMFNK